MALSLGKRKLLQYREEDQLTLRQKRIRDNKATIARLQKSIRIDQITVTRLEKSKKERELSEQLDIFGSLPQEIRYIIMKYMDWVDLYKMAQVCKKWRDAVRESAAHIYRKRKAGIVYFYQEWVTSKVECEDFRRFCYKVLQIQLPGEVFSVKLQNPPLVPVRLPPGLGQFHVTKAHNVPCFHLNGVLELYMGPFVSGERCAFPLLTGVHDVGVFIMNGFNIEEDELLPFRSVTTAVFISCSLMHVKFPKTLTHVLFVNCRIVTMRVKEKAHAMHSVVTVTCTTGERLNRGRDKRVLTTLFSRSNYSMFYTSPWNVDRRRTHAVFHKRFSPVLKEEEEEEGVPVTNANLLKLWTVIGSIMNRTPYNMSTTIDRGKIKNVVFRERGSHCVPPKATRQIRLK